jgi:hypothetical protein
MTLVQGEWNKRRHSNLVQEFVWVAQLADRQRLELENTPVLSTPGIPCRAQQGLNQEGTGYREGGHTLPGFEPTES